MLKSSPRRFQFGLCDLGVSVALLAVALGIGKLFFWIADHTDSSFELGLPLFIAMSVCICSCAFAAVGVLFRCPRKAVIAGAVAGVVVAVVLMVIVFLIAKQHFR